MSSAECVVTSSRCDEDAGRSRNTARGCTGRAAATVMPSSFSTASAKACSWHIGDDIVEPVEIRDRLQIGLVLDQLFGAAMQQADMRIDALDDFAVQFEDKPQHAVRRRMLRPEIDR